MFVYVHRRDDEAVHIFVPNIESFADEGGKARVRMICGNTYLTDYSSGDFVYAVAEARKREAIG